jgi:ribosomal protein S18 acetylase RimI-like enzyme
MTDSVLADRSVKLRAATPDDEPFLLALYASARRAELSGVGWSDEQIAAFVEMQYAAQSKYYRDHYPDASFDIILLGELPVGRLYVARLPGEIRIVDVTLGPDYCGRGLGSRLLRRLQDESHASGRPLRIHVEFFNPALRLYERLGFRQAADRGAYLFMEWDPVNP